MNWSASRTIAVVATILIAFASSAKSEEFRGFENVIDAPHFEEAHQYFFAQSNTTEQSCRNMGMRYCPPGRWGPGGCISRFNAQVSCREGVTCFDGLNPHPDGSCRRTQYLGFD